MVEDIKELLMTVQRLEEIRKDAEEEVTRIARALEARSGMLVDIENDRNPKYSDQLTRFRIRLKTL